MEAKLQRRIQRYGWDKAAPFYERYWQDQLAPAREMLFRLASLTRGEHVLDVACGTGLVTFTAADNIGPSGRIVATDISEAMVHHVDSEAKRRGLEQVEARRGEAEDLQFPDASFDVVLCALGLMYVPDPARSLREMVRVLKRGGRMVSAVWGERKRCGWADIFPIVDARVKSEVCPMFFHLGTGTCLGDVAAGAGFQQLHVERIQTVLHYRSAEDACGAAFAGGPVALAYSRFDDAVREGAHAEYLASIEQYKTSSGYEIPGEFVVVRGRI